MNPDVLLSGGCERSEQITLAEESGRRTLRIMRINRRDAEATVALAPVPSATTAAAGKQGTPQLTGLDLVIEHGEWRINGRTASTRGNEAGPG
jgi:hypothetical protein